MLLIPISSVYGHGLGLETIKMNVGDRKLSITTQISPTEFSEAAQKQITMTVTDSLTAQNVDVVLLIAMYHENVEVFRDYFATTNGVLRIDVNPNTDEHIQFSGQQEQVFDAWYGTKSSPLKISGPILNTGGLYHFEVEIKSIGSETVKNQVFSTYITSITNHHYDKQDKNGNPIKFDVKSYYDKISGFDYHPDTNSITLEMPFDWSEQNISHTEVVHEEIHFPKKFESLLAPSYTGTVNGVDLFKSAITIDDYSIEDQRIIHFVLSQDTLRYLKQAQKIKGVDNPQDIIFVLKIDNKIVFPVITMTQNESLQVDLSWEPETIEPGKNTKFIFTFRDGKTGELLRNTTYDFVILQNGKQIHAKSANAQIGGDYVDYTFSESQKGPITIQFNNLRGTDQKTEFSMMVVPEFGVSVFIILTISTTVVIIFSTKRLVFFQ
jgi:hypothetical protein